MEDLGLIMTLIVGGLAGWIASLFMNTSGQQGIVLNIIVGIIGALVGGFTFNLLGLGGGEGFIGNLIVATIGAIIFLAVVKAFRK